MSDAPAKIRLPTGTPAPPLLAIARRFAIPLLLVVLNWLFVLVLVGTTIQVLTGRSREAFALQRWRKNLRNRIAVVGFGTKVAALCAS